MRTFLRIISFLAGSFLGLVGIFGLVDGLSDPAGGDLVVAIFTLALCAGLMYYALHRYPWEKAEKAATREAEAQRIEAGRAYQRAYAQEQAARRAEESARKTEEKEAVRTQRGPSFWEELKTKQEQRRRERDERTARARAQGLPCCPYCGSTGISANKRGYKVGKGVLWGLLLGFAGFWLFAFVGFAIGLGIGLSFGSFGSGAVTCTCLSCGRRFRPGQRNP